jgi:flagellar biosynthesis chaperone FliJ
MPRFTFELEPVLRLRRRQEEQHQRAVADLERERAAIEDRIRAQQSTISESKRDLRRMLQGERAAGPAETAEGEPWAERGVSLRGARLQANAALHMVVQAQRSVIELAGVHRRLDTARLALLKAMTQRKAVEVLKQKRFEQWKADMLRKEQAEVDDIVSARTVRAMNEQADAGSDHE